MERLRSDITIVGSGIAGLWSAKELLDRGMNVTVVEKGPRIASGATTRNEGWLHAGTYHSVAIADETDARNVTYRTRWGHEAIASFAPEGIDVHDSYAIVKDKDLAALSVDRWDKNGVPYDELNVRAMDDLEGIDTNRIAALFKVSDKSVNSYKVCSKLARDIVGRGGKIFTNTQFQPKDDEHAYLQRGDKSAVIQSDTFLLTAGAGIKDIFELTTGQPFPMRFYKAHLLVFPRLTRANYFYMDNGEAGIMGHDDTSVIGINRDGIEQMCADYVPVSAKEKLVYDATTRMIPRAARYKLDSYNVLGVACVKPDMFSNLKDVQSLNVRITEPIPNYLCALPGKMTESPYMAFQAAEYVMSRGEKDTAKIRDIHVDNDQVIWGSSLDIQLRPADIWMQQHLDY